jgi:hypothetical protein
MLPNGKPGDLVELKDKDGGFTDPDTGFDLSRSQQKKLDEPIGARTQMAIQSGGILIVKATKSAEEKEPPPPPTDKSGIPAEFPGRVALVQNGLNFEQVKTMDKAALVALKGIADKSADAILEAVAALTDEDTGGE